MLIRCSARSWFLLLILSSAGLWAQNAQITGRVTDPSGAVVPDAAVTVKNMGTQVGVILRTNESGDYMTPNLVVGSYSVTVRKEGFKKYDRTGIVLEVGQKAEVNVALEAGSLSQSVDVIADAPRVNTTSAVVGDVIGRQEVEDLPLNGRASYDLIQVQPAARNQYGVTSNYFDARWSDMTGLSINGGPMAFNSVLLDGSEIVDPYNPYLDITPTADSVQEFNVRFGTVSAEYGYTLGGFVSMVTRSGTNQFHGSLSEFLRNDTLDANSWSNNRSSQAKSPLRYNDFGGALGGPIWLPKLYNGRDRSFFFVNYEGFRYVQSSTGLYSLPTAAMHNGDFSQLRDANCNLYLIYDPATTAANPNAPGYYLRQPFPGNVIPQSRLDPVGANIAAYYPLPNHAPANACSNTNNYYGATAEHRTMDEVTYRLDHRFSDHNFLSFRHTIYNQWRDNGAANLYPDPVVRERFDPVHDNNFSLDDVHTFSATFLQEFRLALNRNHYDYTAAGYNQGYPQKLGFPSSIPSTMFPPVSDGLPSFSTTISGWRGTYIWQLFDAITKIHGNHSIKVGTDLWMTQANNFQYSYPSGSYSFPSTLTGNPDPTYTGPNGNGFASLLLGQVSGATATTSVGQSSAGKSYSFFVQDDWKATRRLTLNLGLRYSWQERPYERNNGTSRFSLGINPLTGLPGETQYMKVDFPRVFATNKTDFAPRVGFAYDVRGDQKTVVRGGYSIFYAYAFSSQDDLGDSNGFYLTTTTYSTSNANFPVFQLSQGWPSAPTMPLGAKLGSNLAFSSQDFAMYEFNSRPPMSQQWDFSVQRQLGSSVVVDVTYSGNHDTHLHSASYALNSLDPKYYSLGNQLLQQVANPYAGAIPGVQGSATVSLKQTLLPYPYLGGVTVATPTLGDSIYHALLASVHKRYSNGLVLLAAYTFSKEISNALSGTQTSGGFNGVPVSTSWQNGAYNRRLDRGLDITDVPNRFVTSATYELPFGKGAVRSPWVKAVIGGWQANGILTLSSGLPLEIRGANNQLADRPNVLRKPTLPSNYVDSNSSLGVLWFDPSAFVNPTNWTFGDTPKTLPNFFGPGTVNLDASLFKKFAIREKTTLEFRVEAFNAVNHTNLGLPNMSFTANLGAPANTNPSFGRITTAAEPRLFQLALRLVF